MVDRTFSEFIKNTKRRLVALERQLAAPRKQSPGIPAGTVNPYAGTTAPDGWLLCDGSTFDPVAYPQLAAVVGTQFGSSGGLPRVPNLLGRVVVGLQSSDGDFNVRGKTGGEKDVKLLVTHMPSHSHPGSSVGNRSVSADYSNSNGTSLMHRIRGGNTETGRFSDTIPSSSHDHPLTIASQGGNSAHNNLQPYMALAYIIKAA